MREMPLPSVDGIHYYVLLDHPILTKRNSSDESQSSSFTTADISTINTGHGFASEMMNKIVEEKSKEEARIETLRERKRKLDKLSTQVERLKSISRYSSGQLAGIGHFHICQDTRDVVKERLDDGEQKRKVQESKRKQRYDALKHKYFTARQKVQKNNDNLLSANDLKVLLRHHHFKGDSPIHTKVIELKDQWSRRRHRLFIDTLHESPAAVSNHDVPKLTDSRSTNTLQASSMSIEPSNHDVHEASGGASGGNMRSTPSCIQQPMDNSNLNYFKRTPTTHDLEDDVMNHICDHDERLHSNEIVELTNSHNGENEFATLCG
jgi:hypothetical protein